MNPEVTIIPILEDNFAYLVCEPSGMVAVVDPGEAAPILSALAERNILLSQIWLTHRHADHIGGAEEIQRITGAEIVSSSEIPAFPGKRRILEGEGEFPFGDSAVRALPARGHTNGHLMFLSGDALFSGDVLFIAGCGRIFEGAPAEEWEALRNILALPIATRVFCGHEYAERNLKFAQFLEPENPHVTAEISRVKALRSAGRPSVPSSLVAERLHNPFLRCTEPAMAESLRRIGHAPPSSPAGIFTLLRKLRDEFRS